MRRAGAVLALLACALAATPLAAQPPRHSPRPLPRPEIAAAPEAPVVPEAPVIPDVPGAAVTASTAPLGSAAGLALAPAAAPLIALSANPRLAGFRPLPRPETLALPTAPPPELAAPAPETVTAAAPPTADPRLAGIRPLPRPELASAPMPSLLAPTPRSTPKTGPGLSLKGSVCGVPGILGQEIAPIPAAVRGCGLDDGVKVTAISGIPFSQPLTIDCATAKAMKTWIDRGIVPAVGTRGGGIARIEVFDTYACRPRNNVRGNKVSEHGRGKAIDFAGMKLRNGEIITVLNGWKSQPRLLKAIHAAACGPFGTVLGPQSDRYHLNHIHVDTARYRSGAYCR